MTRNKFGSAILLAGSLITGCLDGEARDEGVGTDAEVGDEETGESTSELTTADGHYTPFSTAYVSSGPASSYPWKGYKTTYPNVIEDFRGYTLPSTIECSSSKSTRSHLDVTSGCLKAVAIGSYSRAQIEGATFRAVALPFAGTQTSPMKWTDQRNEFRFYYNGPNGTGVDPGFKAFVRYRTEYDLYVASWRMDGKVNIKKKINGTYTTLAEINYPKPTTGTWHRLRFDAIGSQLDLYLDGTKVLSARDTTLSWGTAGIRTDAMNGAYLEDWSVR